MIANSIFANQWCMADESSDKDFIQRLVAFTGLSASETAAKAGLAVSTLTRPLNQPVKYKLSKATIDKLKACYPAFPDWAKRPDLPDALPGRDYLEIEIMPSFGGMGGGGSGDGDLEYGMVPRRLIEDELRAKASDFILIEARGSSMEPDFHHGDQILVDKRDRNPVQPGAFALWDGDGYVIKLVERVPQRRGWYRIFSANERYSAYEVEESETVIMGRPVWFARRL